ncbi:hypothetical protein V8B97DRAFT_2024851 [Scleroderma yunnanense]
MASAVSHFKPYTQPHNITCKDIWVITSPNIGFVPEPHIFEDKDLQSCADGHFGLDSVPSLAIVWYDLTRDDFVIPTGFKSAVGTLQDARVKEFKQLLQLLCNCHHHLQDRTAVKEILSVQMSSAQHEVMQLWNHPLVFRDLGYLSGSFTMKISSPKL